MIAINNLFLPITGLCTVLLASTALAENMANPVTGGANQFIPWCSNGTNTYTLGCGDTLSNLLLGPSPGYPDPTPSSPGGNVELGYPPPLFNTTTPTTLSGNFLAGDTITISSLIQSDWTQAFCEQWLTDVLIKNSVPLPPSPNDVTAICQQLIAGYSSLPYYLQRVSNPNVSYVTKEARTVKIGTATVYNASAALKVAFPTLAGQVPDFVQFSEPVKITYLGKTKITDEIKYCAGIGSITATNQWANDAACPYNAQPNLAKQFCSHSGNCEIPIAPPPPPPPGAPIHPLTVWLTMLGLALTTVFYRLRQHRR